MYSKQTDLEKRQTPMETRGEQLPRDPTSGRVDDEVGCSVVQRVIDMRALGDPLRRNISGPGVYTAHACSA